MKNLAQFRKALTVGSRWTLEHASEVAADCRAASPREVVHVQSNAVAFSIPGVAYNGNPYQTASWLYFDGAGGKAKFWEFPDENTAVKYFKAIDGTEGKRADIARMIYRRAVDQRKDK